MESEPVDLRDAGERIERLLAELRTTVDPRAYQRAEELLRLVSELYGGALARVVELACAGGDAGVTVDQLVDDDLVASLMIVHGVHPDGVEARVERALASVRPLLEQHAGGVELLDIDPDAAAVHLRLLGSCDGCPSSTVTLRTAVERAIAEAAPEITRIDVDEPTDPGVIVAASGDATAGPEGTSVPVALVRKPAYDSCPTEAGVG
jgi:Fe-S cluster biogenesis protein NfuA